MLTNLIRFSVKPDWQDRWLDLVEEFTVATRAEPGNLWFSWSRDVDDPGVFYLSEGFRDDAVEEHLRSPVIPTIVATWPAALTETPRMLMATLPGDTWSPMERLPVPVSPVS